MRAFHVCDYAPLQNVSYIYHMTQHESFNKLNCGVTIITISGRPPWKAKGREEAENFFLDALSAWHKELQLGKVVLMGHSLGGYLAATYAMRHPEDVEHLILVCPAGMVRFESLTYLTTPPPPQPHTQSPSLPSPYMHDLLAYSPLPQNLDLPAR